MFGPFAYLALIEDMRLRLREHAGRLREARLSGDGREVALLLGLIETEMLETSLEIGAICLEAYLAAAGGIR